MKNKDRTNLINGSIELLTEPGKVAIKRTHKNQFDSPPEKVDVTGDPDTSFVYAFRCNQFVKIGVTRDLTNRWVALQGANPHTIEKITSRRLGRSLSRPCERFIHCELKPHHRHGEWYECDDVIVHDAFRKMWSYQKRAKS